MIDVQLQMAKEVGKQKREPTLVLADEKLQQKVLERVTAPMNSLLDKPLSKTEFYVGHGCSTAIAGYRALHGAGRRCRHGVPAGTGRQIGLRGG